MAKPPTLTPWHARKPHVPCPAPKGAGPSDGQGRAEPGLSERPAPPPPARSDKAPHYHGHRERLRERFLEAGSEALQDYELLELILFRAMPRRDVKPIAKALLERFGGLAGVLGADPARLMEESGIGQAAMAELKIVHGVALKLLQTQVLEKPLISSWSQLESYLKARLSTEKIEQFRILFLDLKNRLIADEMQQQGTVNHTPVYTREVMRRALELHASSLILVHNHPSGDPTPSRDDVSMTMKIIDAGRAMGITVHDHLIVGRARVLSFRQEGLMGQAR